LSDEGFCWVWSLFLISVVRLVCLNLRYSIAFRLSADLSNGELRERRLYRRPRKADCPVPKPQERNFPAFDELIDAAGRVKI
jgi:hypothetical protein